MIVWTIVIAVTIIWKFEHVVQVMAHTKSNCIKIFYIPYLEMQKIYYTSQQFNSDRITLTSGGPLYPSFR